MVAHKTSRKNISNLHVPEPLNRPGATPDFSDLHMPDLVSEKTHTLPRPDPMIDAYETEQLASGLVRVLTLDGRSKGPWDPKLDADTLRLGLRNMMLTRSVDKRMFIIQRQGKASFYMKSLGEEAIAVASAMALKDTDMVLPSYRQQGLLLTRGYPLRDLMCQVLSNSGDKLEGKAIPICYSSREKAFYSIGASLGTQMSHAIGWAMACAYKGTDGVSCAFTGEGATAEGDFHYALTFSSTYRAPAIINIVNNQWAISSFQGIAAGASKTFAYRGLGFGLASLRIDGNDFLAVYAAVKWASERARNGGGATVIEHFTYRQEGHSTSDDPSAYRAKGEAEAWPFGDPIDRLKEHLIKMGEWDQNRQDALISELKTYVRETYKQAEAMGTLATPTQINPATMFEQVFEDVPTHLRRQRQELGV
ncbi:MAG: 3-methyl-2-oxobutanoate dehydrogenase (2-methylpropanoyl-transferring) subunit alpha [Robiginitomaculum sp.]|nr:3-methyl-2-oxobutanoate dehydrogenase (2-methylpropanoyl-transferring) subunit alpha [Robiginitomaculum sp.]